MGLGWVWVGRLTIVLLAALPDGYITVKLKVGWVGWLPTVLLAALPDGYNSEAAKGLSRVGK